MGRNNGGTEMYCPYCEKYQVCEGDTDVLNDLEDHRSQRQVYTFYGEHLHVFERGRECHQCGNTFVTVEISKDLHDEIFKDRHGELLELRRKLKDLEKYLADWGMVFRQPQSAENFLDCMTKFLEGIMQKRYTCGCSVCNGTLYCVCSSESASMNVGT